MKTGVFCPRDVALLLWLICVAVAAAAEDYQYDPPKPGTYELPVVRQAADGALLDANGKPVNLRELTHGQ